MIQDEAPPPQRRFLIHPSQQGHICLVYSGVLILSRSPSTLDRVEPAASAAKTLTRFTPRQRLGAATSIPQLDAFQPGGGASTGLVYDDGHVTKIQAAVRIQAGARLYSPARQGEDAYRLSTQPQSETIETGLDTLPAATATAAAQIILIVIPARLIPHRQNWFSPERILHEHQSSPSKYPFH